MREGKDVGHLFVAASREQLRQNTSKLLHCLTRLPDDEVWRRTNDHVNSVGNLVLHLCGNLRQWIISGIGGAEDVRQRPREFCPDAFAFKQELRSMVAKTAEEADRVLANFEVGRLRDARLIQGFELSCLETIYGAVEHWSHHVGQIIHMTKATVDSDLALTPVTPGATSPGEP